MADIKNPERRGFESSDEGSAPGGRFSDQAREATSEATQKTREAAEVVRDRLSEQARNMAERGKERLAEAIGDIAVSIREAGHKLHEEHQEGPAGYVDQAADQVGQVARYLKEREVDELYETAEDTVRRHPAVFLGLTFAGGLLAARFLRSSAHRRRSGRRQNDAHQSSRSDTSGASSQGPPAPPAHREDVTPPIGSYGAPESSASETALEPPTERPPEGGERP